MTGGRFLLGLGSQVKAHVERRFAMPWSAPAKRMKEYVQVVKACWHTWQTGEPFGFEGEIYQVNLMPPGMCLPPQEYPNIPVQLAAVGEMMLGVAGEVCEGVRLHDFCSRKYVHQIAIPKLREGFVRSGRPEEFWQAFEITGGGMIATAPTEEALQAEILDLRKRLAFYASTPAYRLQLEIEGYGDQAEKLTSLSKEGRWAEMLDVFSEDMARCYAAVGTHDEIVDRIREHFDGVTTVQFSMPIRGPEDAGRLRELIQDLRS
jgi:probable F420-dependent oxidoreductase